MTPEQESELLASVAAIQVESKSQTAMLQDHGRQLGRIDYTLNGNGKPGLKQDVKDLQDRMATVESSRNTWSRIAWSIGAPVLSAIGGGLVAAGVWLVHSWH